MGSPTSLDCIQQKEAAFPAWRPPSYGPHLLNAGGSHRLSLPDPDSSPRTGARIWVRATYNHRDFCQMEEGGPSSWSPGKCLSSEGFRPRKPSRSPTGLTVKGRGFLLLLPCS